MWAKRVAGKWDYKSGSCSQERLSTEILERSWKSSRCAKLWATMMSN